MERLTGYFCLFFFFFFHSAYLCILEIRNMYLYESLFLDKASKWPKKINKSQMNLIQNSQCLWDNSMDVHVLSAQIRVRHSDCEQKKCYGIWAPKHAIARFSYHRNCLWPSRLAGGVHALDGLRCGKYEGIFPTDDTISMHVHMQWQTSLSRLFARGTFHQSAKRFGSRFNAIRHVSVFRA